MCSLFSHGSFGLGLAWPGLGLWTLLVFTFYLNVSRITTNSSLAVRAIKSSSILVFWGKIGHTKCSSLNIALTSGRSWPTWPTRPKGLRNGHSSRRHHHQRRSSSSSLTVHLQRSASKHLRSSPTNQPKPNYTVSPMYILRTAVQRQRQAVSQSLCVNDETTWLVVADRAWPSRLRSSQTSYLGCASLLSCLLVFFLRFSPRTMLRSIFH